MPGSKTHPLVDKSWEVAGSIVICAILSALITALIGGGLTMIGDAEFTFSLKVFCLTYVVLFIARYTFPKVFDEIFSNFTLIFLFFD